MNFEFDRAPSLWQHKPQLLSSLLGFLLGIAFLWMAIYAMRFGKVWNGYYGWFYRKDNPFVFWAELIGLFVGSILFVLYFGYFLIIR